MADPFPTTLLILYFITGPSHIPDDQPKVQQEAKANWTLQSTSQTETQDPETCISIARQMLKEFETVNTSTIRAYCLCPKGASSRLCFNQEEIRLADKFEEDKGRNFTTAVAPDPATPKVLRIGPATPNPFTKKR
jgi:hypothetical protein